jgi:hypothetical protein
VWWVRFDRGDLARDGRFILNPHCSIVLILDTDEQANAMGSEHAHLLVRREPPPDLALYGAGDAQLRVREEGTMILVFSATAGLPGQISKKTVQMIHAQAGYRIGAVHLRHAPLNDSMLASRAGRARAILSLCLGMASSPDDRASPAMLDASNWGDSLQLTSTVDRSTLARKIFALGLVIARKE